MSSARARADSWLLVLGPGTKLDSLRPLFAALVPPGGSVELSSIRDLGELLALRAERARVLLDVESLPLEDVGIVRRFLTSSAGVELLLLGSDPSQRAARVLSIASPRVRWRNWPLDTDQLHELVLDAPASDRAAKPGPSFESSGPVPAPTPPALAPTSAPKETELGLIQRILAGESERAPPPGAARPSAAKPSDPEPDELFADEFPDEPPLPPSRPPPAPEELRAPSRPVSNDAHTSDASPGETQRAAGTPSWRTHLPPFYRLQIADLADIAQRLQLSFLTLSRADGNPSARNERLAQLEGEVFRLVQFARTLGFLVAPPTGGGQPFDLALLLREQMAGMAGEGPGAPSWQLRAREGLWVRSDKGLLTRAIDAMLALARACATGVEDARVQVEGISVSTADTPARLRVEILFPAGPLGEMRPEEIVEPYALRRRFSALGANALAAAEGILRGQKGALELSAPAPGMLLWSLELPGEPAPSAAAARQETAAGPFE
jgi:hypothetical protein